ncbi:MAG: ornithine cyclodeaminase family protein, partial [Alphaproteobacteria bacterium]
MALDFLTSEAVRSCVSMEACIDLMAATMISVSHGEASIPQRNVVALGSSGNAFVDMPGAIASPGTFGTKIVSFFPGNRELPAIQGLIVVFDCSTGQPKAVVDAAAVTALRTAAASGMATRWLARENSETLALLGYGVQAEYHLRAMQAVRPIKRAIVWGRSEDKAEAFAKRNRSLAGIDIIIAPDARTAVEQSD